MPFFLNIHSFISLNATSVTRSDAHPAKYKWTKYRNAKDKAIRSIREIHQFILKSSLKEKL